MATKEFKTQAAALQTRTILEEAPRGRILDRNGVVLVDNRISVIVTVDAQEARFDQAAERRQRTTALLDRLATEITRYMPTARSTAPSSSSASPTRGTARTCRSRSPTTYPKPLELYLAEHHDLFQDVVSVTQTTIRVVPARAHRLARARVRRHDHPGRARRRTRPARRRTHSATRSARPASRRRTRTTCAARPARQSLEVDAKGNTVRELSDTPPVPGDDVCLTIDANVQAITEQSLHDELANAHNRRNSDGSLQRRRRPARR